MIKRFYKATSGYFDLPPGKGELQFAVRTTDEGKVITSPKNKFAPEFNEIQIDGGIRLRKEFLPVGADLTKILFMDNPDYDALKLRRSAMVTKNIPLEHDDCFVSRWMCLGNLSKENIEKGLAPVANCYCTEQGNWGGIRALKLKKAMLPYIKNIDSEVLSQLESAKTSATFARKFVDWRDTISGRLTYQSIDDGE